MVGRRCHEDDLGRELGNPADPVPTVRGYRVTAPLGHGGSGTVWRATQLATRREVALKLLKPTLFGSAQARAR